MGLVAVAVVVDGGVENGLVALEDRMLGGNGAEVLCEGANVKAHVSDKG